MKVVVTGANGQLGTDVVRAWTAAGDTVLGLGREGLDVTNREAVLHLLTRERPDVVVNCAAWTAVDACESDPPRAQAANADAVAFLAEGCAAGGARLVQI